MIFDQRDYLPILSFCTLLTCLIRRVFRLDIFRFCGQRRDQAQQRPISGPHQSSSCRMKALLLCLVSFTVMSLADPARPAMHGQSPLCPSDPALPDSSVDRSSRVSAIRESLSHKKYDEALQLAENLVKAEGGNYEGYFWRGYIQKQRQELYSAVRSLRNAERLKPVGGAVAKVLALCYDLLDQHQLF